MRDHILLFINGKKHLVAGGDVFLSLSDFLRYRLGLTGTKVVCSEGDCGACSVLVGSANGESLQYQTVDSCIQFIFQLDGRHVVTVEGLKSNHQLNSVQDAMIRCHGSQCGFCTPGFIVTMTGMLETKNRLAERDLREGLVGNLCRCTGYSPIIEAGLRLNSDELQNINELYPPQKLLDDLARTESFPVTVASDEEARRRLFFGPTDLRSATEFLSEHPTATVVAGATDVGVQMNKAVIDPDEILDLNRVAELEGVTVEDGVLTAGARASWTEIEQAVEAAVPQFHQIIKLFGAPQIRNVATIGGNIVNASPIADSLPFLYVNEAELDLVGPDEPRSVNINKFYRGYKQVDLRPGELISQVRIPLPSQDQTLRLYKVSRRRDLDIASFTAALLIRLDGPTIRSAAIALGAVGPTVIRARGTETFLAGRQFTEQTMLEAGERAIDEISPISDVRGSKDFRRQLTRNVFVKFYYEVCESTGPVSV